MPDAPRQSLTRRTVQHVAAAPWFAKIAPRIVPPLDKALHRLSGGRFLLGEAVVPGLVLTTTGAVSGLPRSVPLACLPEPHGSWIVVGSNFGRDRHPAWSGNLLEHPEAEVRFRGRTVPVTARLLDGAEREEVWSRLLKTWPVYARYADRVERELRVFRLIPRS
ncbi:hypothetical protein Arub01_24640 [Actinomadura rubrobrunea]|uniref:Nitroreductase family deazaflavin-dependent oxidoreductase n=1 Tax=Actinomadura rubrobrunea TaxID=115335 RepID=A0A9W6UX11_9ACTN|nr:nitroreductase family deazaflavin-dependent oxidoreductase [Actinomadura rubrobrunea]GLW64220.1 hypothetical protein Arub01_24640 [Actinomadura rubrobrunea]